MSHFYGSMSGARGETTRTGTRASGISAHVRGWDVGISVRGYHDDGFDVFDVYATRGSNGGGSELIATVTLSEDRERLIVEHSRIASR